MSYARAAVNQTGESLAGARVADTKHRWQVPCPDRMITIVEPTPAKIAESSNIASASSVPAVTLHRFGHI